MDPRENLLRIYRELADWYERQHQPQMRDRFLVLAADAALTAGRPDEAERLRLRLLKVNPHHMLKPYGSLAQALKAPDVLTYVKDLRVNYPADVAEDLLRTLQADEKRAAAAPSAPTAPILPVASRGRPPAGPKPAPQPPAAENEPASVPVTVPAPVQPPRPNQSHWKGLLLKVGIRTLAVAIVTGIGSQIGGWAGGIVIALLSSLVAVFLGDVHTGHGNGGGHR